MKLADAVSWLNGLLRLDEIEDYPNAVNGLQVENSGQVTKVAVAVDACERVLEMVVENGCDFLIVHHGMFWSGLAPVTGALHRKLKLALDNDLAIYSAHLPLDAHPRLGNNVLLAQALGLRKTEQFLKIGVKAKVNWTLGALVEKVEQAVQAPVHWAPGGPDRVCKVGIVTGGSGEWVGKAAQAGVDTFIVGEGPHWTFTMAEELGVNLIYAGHYATETFGVKALGGELKKKFGLPWEFLDHPTGL